LDKLQYVLSKAVKVSPFMIPLHVEEAWDIDNTVLAYWVYWTPFGDECIVMRLHDNLVVEGGDADFQAYFELMDFNPHLRAYKLGSSDEEPKEVLLVDKQTNKAFIVPIQIEGLSVRELLSLLEGLRGDGYEGKA